MVAGDGAAADRGVADRARSRGRPVPSRPRSSAGVAAAPAPRGFAELRARCPTARRPCGCGAPRRSRCPTRRGRARARRARRGRRAAPRRARCWRRAGRRSARPRRRCAASARSSSPVVPTRIGMPAATARSRLLAERGGGREIDQHVAMVGIDREAGVGGGRLGDGAAHAAVGGEQGEANRLAVGAHERVMAQRSGGRNPEPLLERLRGGGGADLGAVDHEDVAVAAIGRPAPGARFERGQRGFVIAGRDRPRACAGAGHKRSWRCRRRCTGIRRRRRTPPRRHDAARGRRSARRGSFRGAVR